MKKLKYLIPNYFIIMGLWTILASITYFIFLTKEEYFLLMQIGMVVSVGIIVLIELYLKIKATNIWKIKY